MINVMKKISIIVPCYNEQEVLPLFYAEVRKVLMETGLEYEILFVDDGSTDGTARVIEGFAAEDEGVKYYSFSRNFGKEAAMYAGFCNASGDYTAVMDADLQDPPSLLPQMIELLESGEYDSVAARRVSRKGEPKIRSFFARQFYKVINRLTGAEIADGARDFRLMKREMADAVVKMGESNRFTKGIFGWIGFRTYWLPYENAERAAGETKWSFHKLLVYALDGIINFSVAPLKMASTLGLVMTFVSAFFLLFIFIRRLVFGDPVAGWASTACIIIFIGGIQMFSLGIMGEYIAKTYTEVKKRPHYIIAKSNDGKAEKIR